MMQWHDNQLLALISYLKERPVLWSLNSRGCEDESRKTQECKKIAVKMRCDVEEIRDKVRDLKLMYLNELALQKLDNKTSSEQPWRYFKHLHFLRESIKGSPHNSTDRADDGQGPSTAIQPLSGNLPDSANSTPPLPSVPLIDIRNLPVSALDTPSQTIQELPIVFTPKLPCVTASSTTSPPSTSFVAVRRVQVPVSTKDTPSQVQQREQGQVVFSTPIPSTCASSTAPLQSVPVIAVRRSLPVSAKETPSQVERGRPEQIVFPPTIPSPAFSTAQLPSGPFIAVRSLPASAKDTQTQVERGKHERTVYAEILPSTSASPNAPPGPFIAVRRSLPASAKDSQSQVEQKKHETVFSPTIPTSAFPTTPAQSVPFITVRKHLTVSPKDTQSQVEQGKHETVFSTTIPSSVSLTAPPQSIPLITVRKHLTVSPKDTQSQVEQRRQEPTIYSSTIPSSASLTAPPQSIPLITVRKHLTVSPNDTQSQVEQRRQEPTIYSQTIPSSVFSTAPAQSVPFITVRNSPTLPKPSQVEQEKHEQIVFSSTLPCASATSTAPLSSVPFATRSLQVAAEGTPCQVEQRRNEQTVVTPQTLQHTFPSSSAPMILVRREIPLHQNTQEINQVQTKIVSHTGAKEFNKETCCNVANEPSTDEYDTFISFIVSGFRNLKSDAVRKWLKRAFLDAIVNASEVEDDKIFQLQQNFLFSESNIIGSQQPRTDPLGSQQPQADPLGSQHLQSHFIDSHSLSKSSESPSPSTSTGNHSNVAMHLDGSRTTVNQEVPEGIFGLEADVVVKEELLDTDMGVAEEVLYTINNDKEIRRNVSSPDSSKLEVTIQQGKRKRTCSEDAESSQQDLPKRKEKTKETSSEPEDLFASYVATTLKKFPQRARFMAKVKIQQALMEAEKEAS